MLLEEVAERFCNHTFERMVLSASMNNIDKFYNTVSKIKSSDLLSDDNKLVFSILKDLQNKGIEDFDINVIAEYAKDLGVYEALGGYDYLLALNRMPVSNDNYDLALKSILEASSKFKLYIDLLDSKEEVLKSASMESDTTLTELIGKVQTNLLNLSINSFAIEEPKNASDGLFELLEERRKNKVEVLGLSTGYPILDKVIDGHVNGTLTIIAARKKHGKSTLLTNMASHSAFREGRPVLYLDTEMTFSQWRDRTLAMISGVKERTIKHGGYDDDTYRTLIKAAKLLESKKLFHHYVPGYNINTITSLYKKYKLKEDIQLAVFDYIKEPESSSVSQARKEHQILGDVTTALKDLAGMLDIPFLAAVQLNRTGDVADSDRVARYGDVVAFWGPRTPEEIKEYGLDPDINGHYRLQVMDSRRGSPHAHPSGIGFYFFKETLEIKEVPLTRQISDFGMVEARPKNVQ